MLLHRSFEPPERQQPREPNHPDMGMPPVEAGLCQLPDLSGMGEDSDPVPLSCSGKHQGKRLVERRNIDPCREIETKATLLAPGLIKTRGDLPFLLCPPKR